MEHNKTWAIYFIRYIWSQQTFLQSCIKVIFSKSLFLKFSHKIFSIALYVFHTISNYWQIASRHLRHCTWTNWTNLDKIKSNQNHNSQSQNVVQNWEFHSILFMIKNDKASKILIETETENVKKSISQPIKSTNVFKWVKMKPKCWGTLK